LAVVDLLAFSKKGEEVSIRRAMAWTLIWSAIGVAFAGLVWAMGSAGAAGEYLAGYLIERSLSIDNVFVFALVFAAFSIPIADQDRPLLIGIIGALALRAIFIVLGAAALETFHWAVYVFGALLVIVAIRMATSGQGEVHPEHNPLVRLAGNNPKVAVLVAIMTADLVFAIDSIPAIFAITTDTFIVFAANAFSLLGMRPLYFLLAGAMDRFPYLKYGLAAVLAFVGAKMLATDIVHLPVWLSLVVIVLLLGLSIGVSLLRSPGRPQRV
jgi:tellurite resistance protein TerC